MTQQRPATYQTQLRTEQTSGYDVPSMDMGFGGSTTLLIGSHSSDSAEAGGQPGRTRQELAASLAGAEPLALSAEDALADRLTAWRDIRAGAVSDLAP